MRNVSILLILLAVMMSSCATIFCGTRQNVTINSNPDGATVYVVKKNQEPLAIGKTPLSVKIKKNTPMIVLKKENYCDTVLFSKKLWEKEKIINGSVITVKKIKIAKYNRVLGSGIAWYFGNLVLGGIIGMGIDLGTGAYINLPREMQVDLAAKKH